MFKDLLKKTGAVLLACSLILPGACTVSAEEDIYNIVYSQNFDDYVGSSDTKILPAMEKAYSSLEGKWESSSFTAGKVYLHGTEIDGKNVLNLVSINTKKDQQVYRRFKAGTLQKDVLISFCVKVDTANALRELSLGARGESSFTNLIRFDSSGKLSTGTNTNDSITYETNKWYYVTALVEFSNSVVNSAQVNITPEGEEEPVFSRTIASKDLSASSIFGLRIRQYDQAENNGTHNYYVDDIVITEVPEITAQFASPSSQNPAGQNGDNKFEIEFSHNMDESALRVETVSVYDGETLLEGYNVSLSENDSKKAIIEFPESLEAGKEYIVKFTDVVNADGFKLTTEQIVLKTAQLPQITVTEPADGASIDFIGNELTVRANITDAEFPLDTVTLMIDSEAVTPVSQSSEAEVYTWVLQNPGFGKHSISINAVNSIGVEATATTEFVLVPRTAIITAVNSAENLTDFTKAVTDTYYQEFKDIGLYIDDYISDERIHEDVFNAVSSAVPYEVTDEGESLLKTTFNTAAALSAVNHSEDAAAVKTKVLLYNDTFGIPMAEDSYYSMLEQPDVVYKYLYDIKQKQPFDTTDSVYEGFRKAIIIPLVNELYREQLQEALTTDFNDILSLPLTGDYASLDELQKAEVWNAVKLSGVSSYNLIEGVFEAAVEKCMEADDEEDDYDYDKDISTSNRTNRGNSGGGSVTIIQPPAVEPAASSFDDTSSVPWAEESIEELFKMGVINGISDRIFSPEENVTREQLVKMLVKLFEIQPAEESKEAFSDVDMQQWYAEYVYTASENGIVTGFDGKFGVGQNITRQDIAVMTYRAMKHAGFNQDISAAGSFVDAQEIAPYALEAVQALHSLNVISGMGDSIFAPNECATRAQAAKILYNAWQKTITKEE